VVEAPAGCGKTTSGAEYARGTALAGKSSRLLILTHTHGACSVFAERTKDVGSGVEIRTIDSVIARIASAYHAGLGLPADVSTWVRQRQDGYGELALSVSALLRRHPMIVASLAHRHRIVICDEHQDSSGEQHAIVMALQHEGARLRIFGDPMQKIFRERARVSTSIPCDWDALTREAQAYEQLDHPHRWTNGCQELGQWTLAARSALKARSAIDLRGRLPRSVTVVIAENQSQRNLDYQLLPQDRRPIDTFERSHPSLLILTRYNDTARSLRGFFNRRVPL
jgi:DNA helicase-2/ATP-dependent DNA helicase PcrA